MVFIREKKIAGRNYLYLVKSVREYGKVRQKVIKYLGPKDQVTLSDVPKKYHHTVSISARERACARCLQKLPKDKFILVGARAVSAYQPRTTTDNDIVLRENDLKSFSKTLHKLGFKEVEKRKKEHKIPYEGEFRSFKKEILKLPVYADLMVNLLKVRQTGTGYSFDYLRYHSGKKDVRIPSIRRYAKDLITPDKEMMLALKLNAGRLRDLMDAAALFFAKGRINQAKVGDHLKRCPMGIVRKNISEALKVLRKQKNAIKGRFPGISNEKYVKKMPKIEKSLRALRKTFK